MNKNNQPQLEREAHPISEEEKLWGEVVREISGGENPSDSSFIKYLKEQFEIKRKVEPSVEDKNNLGEEDLEKLAREYAGSNYLKNHMPKIWNEKYVAFIAGYRAKEAAPQSGSVSNPLDLETLIWDYISFVSSMLPNVKKSLESHLTEKIKELNQYRVRIKRELETQSGSGVWQLCPKCNGQGTVSKPPYVAGDVNEWISTSAIFTCDVCNGAKILATPQLSGSGVWVKALIDKIDKDILLNKHYDESPRLREGAAIVKVMALEMLSQYAHESKLLPNEQNDEVSDTRDDAMKNHSPDNKKILE